METYGWLSLIPPIVAIGLALKTKQVYLSLGLFILIGWTIMSGMNPVTGLIKSVDVFLAAVTEPGNARTLMFSALIGAIITFTQASGGMEGFVNWIDKSRLVKSKRSVGLIAGLVSMSVFLESNFGLLVSGSVARPLFDKAKISREKLAYILDATCAPKQLLIPINAWGAYIVGILMTQGVDEPVKFLLSSLPLNFYSIIALLMAFFVIVTNWNIGPMKEAERRVSEDGLLLRPGAEPMISDEVTTLTAPDDVPRRAINMLAPIITMVATVPIVLWLTGDGDILAGSGSQAVLWGVIVGLIVGSVLYAFQGIMGVKELTEYTLKGIQGLTPVVIVLALAFGISATQKELGTGIFLAQAAQSTINPGFIPAIIFILACIMAFSTGTSWGTFAIMIPIVIPMTNLLDIHPALTLAAALGGGIFGDHCSPISDSTIVASMASASDHIDHVRTQLPYAMTAAGISLVLFVIAGFTLG
ncbi:MAG: sodium:solute symporter [Bacteroidetes bacterium]|nr:sodium:solute symporter [Bacteroidota bacterium]